MSSIAGRSVSETVKSQKHFNRRLTHQSGTTTFCSQNRRHYQQRWQPCSRWRTPPRSRAKKNKRASGRLKESTNIVVIFIHWTSVTKSTCSRWHHTNTNDNLQRSPDVRKAERMKWQHRLATWWRAIRPFKPREGHDGSFTKNNIVTSSASVQNNPVRRNESSTAQPELPRTITITNDLKSDSYCTRSARLSRPPQKLNL